MDNSSEATKVLAESDALETHQTGHLAHSPSPALGDEGLLPDSTNSFFDDATAELEATAGFGLSEDLLWDRIFRHASTPLPEPGHPVNDFVNAGAPTTGSLNTASSLQPPNNDRVVDIQHSLSTIPSSNPIDNSSSNIARPLSSRSFEPTQTLHASFDHTPASVPRPLLENTFTVGDSEIESIRAASPRVTGANSNGLEEHHPRADLPFPSIENPDPPSALATDPDQFWFGEHGFDLTQEDMDNLRNITQEAFMSGNPGGTPADGTQVPTAVNASGDSNMQDANPTHSITGETIPASTSGALDSRFAQPAASQPANLVSGPMPSNTTNRQGAETTPGWLRSRSASRWNPPIQKRRRDEDMSHLSFDTPTPLYTKRQRTASKVSNNSTSAPSPTKTPATTSGNNSNTLPPVAEEEESDQSPATFVSPDRYIRPVPRSVRMVSPRAQNLRVIDSFRAKAAPKRDAPAIQQEQQMQRQLVQRPPQQQHAQRRHGQQQHPEQQYSQQQYPQERLGWHQHPQQQAQPSLPYPPYPQRFLHQGPGHEHNGLVEQRRIRQQPLEQGRRPLQPSIGLQRPYGIDPHPQAQMASSLAMSPQLEQHLQFPRLGGMPYQPGNPSAGPPVAPTTRVIAGLQEAHLNTPLQFVANSAQGHHPGHREPHPAGYGYTMPLPHPTMLPYGGMLPQAVTTPMASPLTNTGPWTWALNPYRGPGALQYQQASFVPGAATHAASSERLPLDFTPIPANTGRPSSPHGTGIMPTASAHDAGPVASPYNQGSARVHRGSQHPSDSSQRGASRPRSPSRGAQDENDSDVEISYVDGNYLGDGYVDLPFD